MKSNHFYSDESFLQIFVRRSSILYRNGLNNLAFLADSWSLGVILYILVCGASPFQEANKSETLTMIMDYNYVVPSHITQQCQRLISAMLCRDQGQRATLEQVQYQRIFQKSLVKSVNRAVFSVRKGEGGE